jgi:hypothetical protein
MKLLIMQFSPTSYSFIPLVCMFVSLLYFKLTPIYLTALRGRPIFKYPVRTFLR